MIVAQHLLYFTKIKTCASFQEAATEGEVSYVQGNFSVHDNEDSDGLLHSDDAMQDDSDDGDVSSQRLPPYVGMVFDTIKDAKKFYNDYAFKLGFRHTYLQQSRARRRDRSKRMS